MKENRIAGFFKGVGNTFGLVIVNNCIGVALKYY